MDQVDYEIGHLALFFVLSVLNAYQLRVKDIALIVRDYVQRFWTHVGIGELLKYFLNITHSISTYLTCDFPKICLSSKVFFKTF